LLSSSDPADPGIERITTTESVWRSGLNPEFVPYIATVKALAGRTRIRATESIVKMYLLYPSGCIIGISPFYGEWIYTVTI
jgi:hypothetical protein